MSESNLIVRDGQGTEQQIQQNGLGTVADPFTAINGALDATNSTVALLGAGISFTGDWADVSKWSSISVSFIASVGVDVTLYFDVSHDGGATFATIPRSIEDTSFDVPHMFAVAERYLRIRILNGTTGMTGTFSASTMCFKERGIDLANVPNDRIAKSTEATYFRPLSDFNQDRNQGDVTFEESVRVVGRNAAVGNALEGVWSVGALNTPNQTAEGFRVKAGGNAADTSAGAGARTVVITFLDSTWAKVTETLTLAGASASASTSVTGYRVLDVQVDTSGTYHASNTGIITIENDVTNTVQVDIPATEGDSSSSYYTVPLGFTAYIDSIFVSVGQANSADVILYEVHNADDFSAPFTSVKHREWGVDDFSGAETFPLTTQLKFDEKSDIWFEAIRVTGAGNAEVSVEYDIILVKN